MSTEVQDKSTVNLSITNQMVEQILIEGKRPMSPKQIQTKYKLTFPFTVKRVVSSAESNTYCSHQATGIIGEYITFYSTKDSNGAYCYHEPSGCEFWLDTTVSFSIKHDSERFVLANDP